MRDVINCVKAAVLYLHPSPCDYQKEACPSYHLKGLCNAHCSWSRDHNPYPGSGDGALMDWSQRYILGRGG